MTTLRQHTSHILLALLFFTSIVLISYSNWTWSIFIFASVLFIFFKRQAQSAAFNTNPFFYRRICCVSILRYNYQTVDTTTRIQSLVRSTTSFSCNLQLSASCLSQSATLLALLQKAGMESTCIFPIYLARVSFN